jgi:hypothetical protein
MSDQFSDRILVALREDAGKRSRPAERNATIDRLVEACEDIANGRARSVIKEGLPHAEVSFLRACVPIKPPRIHEYVRARFQLDLQARRQHSQWTGPTATTLRKDAKLLEYVRAREQEQLALVPGKVKRSADQVIDEISDLGLRTELRLLFARALQSEQDLNRLKEGMRRMRPTLDIDLLIAGKITPRDFAQQVTALPSDRSKGPRKDDLAHAIAALAKLRNSSVLSRCGLELNKDHGNLVEKTTRFELLTRQELEGLRALVSHHSL